MKDLEQDLEEHLQFEGHQIDHKVEEAESSAYENSFDSCEEPEDQFELDYGSI